MKKKISLIILSPILVYAMSIDEAVQNTISTNPQIEIKKEELYTEKELLTVSKSDYLPKVDVDFSFGPENTKTVSNSREDVGVVRQDASATIRQNIFAGFDTVNGVKQQKALILSATQGLNEKANLIAIDVVTAYIDILKNNELLKIAKENIDVHEKYLSQIKERIDAGVGRLSDYKQTLSRYENTKSTYYRNEQNYKNSFYNFQKLLPEDMKIENMVKPVSGDLPVATLDELTALALKSNPSVLLSKFNVKYARSTVERSSAYYYPRVDIVAKSYWNKNLNGYSKEDEGRGTGGNPYVEGSGYNALLVFNYNIFNGLSDSSNEEANRHKLLRERASLIDVKRSVEASTKIAWQVFQSTQQELIHIDKNIEASAQTVKYYKKENDLGRRSIIDLLNIELEYNNARNRKVTAEYDHLLAYYQILAQTNKLLEKMSVVIK
jgi:adhesin transport system outer membrane protein